MSSNAAANATINRVETDMKDRTAREQAFTEDFRRTHDLRGESLHERGAATRGHRVVLRAKTRSYHALQLALAEVNAALQPFDEESQDDVHLVIDLQDDCPRAFCAILRSRARSVTPPLDAGPQPPTPRQPDIKYHRNCGCNGEHD